MALQGVSDKQADLLTGPVIPTPPRCSRAWRAEPPAQGEDPHGYEQRGDGRPLIASGWGVSACG